MLTFRRKTNKSDDGSTSFTITHRGESIRVVLIKRNGQQTVIGVDGPKSFRVFRADVTKRPKLTA